MSDQHARVVKEITDALYPILFPVQQQDYGIQARNYAQVEQAAKTLWEQWLRRCSGEMGTLRSAKPE